jgi:hypothetical protein
METFGLRMVSIANDVRYITSGPDGNVLFTESNKIGRINLSVPTPTPNSTNPCPPGSPSECLLASNAAYGLDTNNFVAPGGMTMLVRSDYINSSWRSDGFEAVALQDSHGNIIIANEGTVSGVVSTYDRNTLLSDLQIAQDKSSAQVLSDAINFAGSVLSAYYGKPGYGGIYVTGHSLGGIEAEAEAKALGNIAGGATFGATGLPGNTTAGGPQSLIDYVDYGDPVGNYASDSNSQLNDHTAGVMYHYGQIRLVGSPLNASNLQTAAVTRNAALSPYLEGIGKIRAKENQAILNLCAGMNVAIARELYHSIDNYASDLQIMLPSTGTVSTLNAGDIMLTYDEELGATGLTNLEKITEQANGTLASPDVTISSNPQTDQISIRDLANVQAPWGMVAAGGTTTLYIEPSLDIVSGVKYVSPDGSQYLVHLDGNNHADNIQINPIQGGSYQVTYDTTKSQSWSSRVNIYTRRNEQGTLIKAIYNWRPGRSQVQLFTGLPRGDTVELKNYSGPNGTGKLLSVSYK